jgi:hypothetical protein
MTIATTVLFWRKVDFPGHDSCQLIRLSDGWRISGAAVFMEARHVCQLQYDVTADAAFRTKSATVTGFVGKNQVDVRIRSIGKERWRVNGKVHADITGCLDVDLGFTPATNLLVLRRLALKVGQQADAPAAYLAFPRMQVVVLPQRYERISRNEYAYESPTAGYRDTLQVSSQGAVIRYPGLFELVSPR